MAVTMICIGMPVCRPAVSSMLQRLGIRIHLLHTSSSSSPAHKEHNNSNKSGGGGGGGCGHHHNNSSSYIRNFGANATWDEAICARDVDSWSQRRILGVGDTTSGAIGAGNETPGLESGGGGGGGGGSGTEFETGFPMRTMSKGGITVTKTVDITNGSNDSR